MCVSVPILSALFIFIAGSQDTTVRGKEEDYRDDLLGWHHIYLYVAICGNGNMDPLEVACVKLWDSPPLICY